MAKVKNKRAEKILRKQLELLAQVSEREPNPSSLSMLTRMMVRIAKKL